jgi:phospholipase C
MRWARIAALLLLAALVAAAAASFNASGQARAQEPSNRASSGRVIAPVGIHKIRHIVIIMQENRSFDNYFGTYPGADGIPGLAGNPGTVPCLPREHGSCVKPFHDRHDRNHGGPHSSGNAIADIDHGKMNGFILQEQKAAGRQHIKISPPYDTVGYHTGKEIPNYWTYARDFVLQDHMFQPDLSWSLPAHLYLVSEWSAHCTKKNKPMSCKNSLDHPGNPPGTGPHPRSKAPDYAWTDLTYLLDKHHVQWRYYIFKGIEPDCESNTQLTCRPVTQGPRTNPYWNPLRYFDTVRDDHQLGDIQSLNGFFNAAHRGRLPAVSWIVPNGIVSEHPPGRVSPGQTYVTGLINTIMQSPEWKSTAIFLAWDDWSGFYDNVVPPRIDRNGYGLRVPALVISPYARHGYIDHQVLSFDAYAKFIEADFLGGLALNPRTDGRPDPRPDVREKARQLGNLVSDFNFNQSPRKPVLLPVQPKTDFIEP